MLVDFFLGLTATRAGAVLDTSLRWRYIRYAYQQLQARDSLSARDSACPYLLLSVADSMGFKFGAGDGKLIRSTVAVTYYLLQLGSMIAGTWLMSSRQRDDYVPNPRAGIAASFGLLPLFR
jgi:hypothetical protein